MDTEHEVGTLAATRQTWKSVSVRDIFIEVIEANPDAGEDKLRRKFRALVESDADYLNAVADYAFDNALNAHRKHAAAQSAAARAQKAAVRAERAQVVAHDARVHADRVEYVKQQIILLNQEMPNGKRMRFCTLDYIYNLGGAYKRLGERGSQKLVQDKYNEDQLRARMTGLTGSS